MNLAAQLIAKLIENGELFYSVYMDEDKEPKPPSPELETLAKLIEILARNCSLEVYNADTKEHVLLDSAEVWLNGKTIIINKP